ncbi:serine acetyltransferase [Vibrio cyclitrophicus]|uniref:serine acetyltransferase n=1 Tax=Vibrio cyclitrophicus TaxID=47951 RepID=UPI003999810C
MFKKIIWFFYGRSSERLKYLHSLASRLKRKNLNIISKIISNKIEREFNCFISLTANIHESVEFIHPTGIIIGKGVVISENVKIYQQVTIGGKNRGDWNNSSFPRIGRNSILYSGFKVLGDIDIGDNCIVGSNSVVISSMPSNSLIAGAPAVVKKSME